MARVFTDYEAATATKEMPLLIGITGPSFSGKSYSAGRLATGIQRVYGGKIYWGDTENDRALELKSVFNFQHVPFPQPKSPGEYEDLLDYFLAKPDIGVGIFDNCTHEHIALLNMMEEYFERKGIGDDWQKRDRALFASMVLPKGQRRRFNEKAAFGAIRRSDGRKVPLIFLYRGQDKTKPGKSRADGGDGKPIHKGWQAETTSDLPYYMTARFLLPPGSDGHPNLTPDTEYEKLSVKNPQQFRDWFKSGFQLSEEIGERMARWARGEAANGEADQAAALRQEIGALLRKHHDGDDKKAQEARASLVLGHFGAKTMREFNALDHDKLRAGLDALQLHLEGPPLIPFGDDGAPEPGADDEEIA